MAGKKIKLDEEANNEILVADTNSKSGSEASDFEDYFEEEEEDDDDDDKPQQKSKHRLQQVADYQPGDRLKEGRQILILSSEQQKV